ncbi:S-adenosyl-L-methionine-dependent methyltransferase [Xylariaceae sp. AK1471]|nr:S-adenosyl-L-methionine-dependent methyltransferase [Xylariaceae sp. AK1471]
MSSNQQPTEYPLDNDNEADRLLDQHVCIKHFMGAQLVLAPVDLSQPNLRILDSGTADGAWLVDVRQMLASPSTATLVGTDISEPRFSTTVPEGVSFRIQNVRDPWPVELHNSFDLVHQRLVMAGAGPHGDKVIAELVNTVAPGGWIQLIETVTYVGDDDGPALKQFLALLKEMFTKLGTNPNFSENLAEWLEKAGCVNVESRVLDYDMGAKIKNPEVRARSLRTMGMAVAGVIGGLSQMGEVQCATQEELDTLPSRLHAELASQGGSYPLNVVWGQKPQK